MKTTSLLLGVLLVISTFSGSAAADTKRKSGSSSVMSEYRTPSGDGAPGVGIGFATYGSGAMPGVLAHALSLWLNFNNTHSLQPFFGINGTGPFAFGAGAIYRATVAGTFNSGFHVGGGFNLGTVAAAGVGGGSTFFTNIFPIGGFHFTLGSHVNNVALSFDGGPIFAVTPAPVTFAVVPISGLAGASIHYFF